MAPTRRRITAVLAAGCLAGLGGLTAAGAPVSAATARLPVMKNIGSAEFTSMAGATALDTTRTVANFHDSYVDPTNGVTYGYNMVGARPSLNSSTTIKTVIIPIDVVFSDQGGFTLHGSDAAAAFAASPLFTDATYAFAGTQDRTQYADAMMRAQFDKLGSGYHVLLKNTGVLPVQTLTVSKKHGTAGQFGDSSDQDGSLIEIKTFSEFIKSVMARLKLDPTTLPIFATHNTFLYEGTTDNCCILGYHGTQNVVGNGGGAASGNGKQPVLTFAWASYIMPGVWDNTAASINPQDPYDKYGTMFLQDIHGFSHEIAEWADDPFVNNGVNPWLTPTAPQYGCTSVLETGDPVVGIGFRLAGNASAMVNQETGAPAVATSDGSWHPEDEVMLPWFARQRPSAASAGRYTLMGYPANDYPAFNAPATGC